MKTALITNWKTTLTGLALAIWTAVYPLISTGQISWPMVASAALIALVTALMKDFDVTGGTTPATSEAIARVPAPEVKPPSKLKIFLEAYRAASNIANQKAAEKPATTETTGNTL